MNVDNILMLCKGRCAGFKTIAGLKLCKSGTVSYYILNVNRRKYIPEDNW